MSELLKIVILVSLIVTNVHARNTNSVLVRLIVTLGVLVVTLVVLIVTLVVLIVTPQTFAPH